LSLTALVGYIRFMLARVRLALVFVALAATHCGKSPPTNPPVASSARTNEAAASVSSAPTQAHAACDPNAVPTCKDDRFIATCKSDGTLETTDCTAQHKRCLNGMCVEPVCEPGKLHCSNGNLYRCNEAGSDRTLVEDCLGKSPQGGANSVCQPDLSPPACRKTCKSPGSAPVVLSQYDCGACEWAEVAFCAEESPERACSTVICADNQLGAGATMLPCYRETTGLVVPGSEKRGPCTAAEGTMTITYEVCQGGKATPASRTVPCQKR